MVEVDSITSVPKEIIPIDYHIIIKEDFDVIDVDHMPYFSVFPAWIVAKLKRKKVFCSSYFLM